MPQPPTALTVIGSIDRVLRDTTVFSLAIDDPETGILAYDFADSGDHVRRIVSSSGGVISDEWVELDHTCLSCALREDIIPALASMGRDRRWNHIALALPVSAELSLVTPPLAAATNRGGALSHLRLAATLAVVDGTNLEEDLLGAQLTAERGIGLGPDDERVLGEPLATNLEYADVIQVASTPTATASSLIDLLRAPDSARLEVGKVADPHSLKACRHDADAADRRRHPAAGIAHPPRQGRGRAWVLDLASDRPFHPTRLLQNIEAMGAGRIRTRGTFRVMGKPTTRCLWDGAGGQLAIGALAPGLGPGTDASEGRTGNGCALRFIGTDSERESIISAFEDSLVQPQEFFDPTIPWRKLAEPLMPWIDDEP
ncbi:GTP-binding protein [Rarobacter incanus]|uniref:G3E family GTPase n=1 Tax=Rarobacter incanus TaxID=153494 RepID=A0A542SQQ5_9MICO|nr:GTP-binding protein [Rarobacter incanus]TQK76953.1 G3E family GTPase [Rarobacter incanus]